MGDCWGGMKQKAAPAERIKLPGRFLKRRSFAASPVSGCLGNLPAKLWRRWHFLPTVCIIDDSMLDGTNRISVVLLPVVVR
jgi:hypothetical protein